MDQVSAQKQKQFDEVSLTESQALFECPICLQSLVLPISLYCGHTFCQPCIKSSNFKFLRNVCPLCRKKIQLRINIYTPNIILEKLLIKKYGKDKVYLKRLETHNKVQYPKIIRIFQEITKIIKDKLPWIVIICLFYHLLKVKIKSFPFSWDRYRKKALQIADSIKGQDSLDFKFILFSQFIRVLFSHIIIP